MVRTLKEMCVLLVAAEHVRRTGQQFKVLRREGLLPIAARQRLIRLAPGILRIGLTAPRQLRCSHDAYFGASRRLRPSTSRCPDVPAQAILEPVKVALRSCRLSLSSP
jgi:hypothetical protein